MQALLTKLLRQIAETTPQRNDNVREVREYPEAQLVALLVTIKDKLTSDDRVSAMLCHTVEESFYDTNIERAKRMLRRRVHREKSHGPEHDTCPAA